MSHIRYKQPRVGGVSTGWFKEPIQIALRTFEERNGGGHALNFSPRAVNLLSGGNRPYSAMSKTPISYLGETAGILSVVALGPGENTGSVMPAAKHGRGLRREDITPKSRAGIRTELYLPIAALDLTRPDAEIEPVQFAGSLSVFSMFNGETEPRQSGTIGQGPSSFRATIESGNGADPTVTLLIRRDERKGLGLTENGASPNGALNYPFGIAYALQNPYADKIQVFARATITLATIGEQAKALDPLLIPSLRGQVVRTP